MEEFLNVEAIDGTEVVSNDEVIESFDSSSDEDVKKVEKASALDDDEEEFNAYPRSLTPADSLQNRDELGPCSNSILFNVGTGKVSVREWTFSLPYFSEHISFNPLVSGIGISVLCGVAIWSMVVSLLLVSH